MSVAVEVTGAVKRYGDFVAVDHMSFSIPTGTIFGMLGPNGAGKTSTIRMIMRITLPDEGQICVLGQDVSRLAAESIGYLPEERGLYKKMRVLDLLTFFGEIRGLKRDEARRRGAAWLDRLGLAANAKSNVEDLSKGMQQKVQFIATVIHEPDLLILDEPFSGLDPVNANVLKDIILEYHARGHTIIFSTHMMEQVEKMCQRICLINKGAIVLDGALADVKRRYGRGGVTLRFEGDGAFLASVDGVEHVNHYGNEVFIRLREGTDPMRVLDAARAKLSITRFDVAEPTIHDIFIEQVSR